ncbi:MAG: hypothetical protein ACTSR3_04535 [Candidatus Helarchaeota archaeon]
MKSWRIRRSPHMLWGQEWRSTRKSFVVGTVVMNGQSRPNFIFFT